MYTLDTFVTYPFGIYKSISEINVCGGVAVKNSHFVTSREFLEEFTDYPAYGDLLASIPVRLITHPDTGLLGAAAYGAMLLDEGRISGWSSPGCSYPGNMKEVRSV